MAALDNIAADAFDETEELQGIFVPKSVEDFTPEQLLEYEERKLEGSLPGEINRTLDPFFKFLFGAPERKPLLLDLLNTTLTAMRYEALTDIELVDREFSPFVLDGKGIRLDLVGSTTSGRRIDLELQRRDENFVERALFNSGTIIYRQLSKGNDYGQLRQTIFVGLVDFTMFKGEKKWFWDFLLCNPETARILTQDLLMIFVEMTKLDGALKSLRQQLKEGKLDLKDAETRLALWGGYIGNRGVDLVMETQASDPVFGQVMAAEKDYWGDSRNRFLQMLVERAERDKYSFLKSSVRKAFNDGKVAGFNDGKVAGFNDGKVAVARNLFKLGLSPEQISEASGLSIKDIHHLREGF